jgi:hypothetical protein
MSIFLLSERTTIMKWGAIALVILAFLYLVIVSFIVRDVKYPKEHPYLFTLETLLVGLGGSASIFLMAYGRDKITISTVMEFLLLAVKFSVFHILFQLSGFYDYVFDYKSKSVVQEVKQKLL